MSIRTSSSCLLLGAAALWLAGCQTQPVVNAPEVDSPCVVTPAAYAHIMARHCAVNPLPNVNQFVPAYCNQPALQTFCRTVQNAPNKTRVVQQDGRIRYDANLGIVVGTVGEKCGRMVMEPNGNVVTEFPELQGAPTPPACQ